MMSKNKTNQFSQTHFIELTKKRFRKKFKKGISAREINKICKDWIQLYIIDNVLDGQKVKIDKHSSIRVIGRPVLEDENFKSLIRKGKIMNRGGVLVDDNRSLKRKDYKYKIVYENKLAKNKALYFKASASFSKQVHQSLINTNQYYPILTK